MTDTVKVRFLRTEQYECDGRNQGPTFHEGSVHAFDRDFADRWIRREAAVEVHPKTKLTPAATGVVKSAPEAAKVEPQGDVEAAPDLQLEAAPDPAQAAIETDSPDAEAVAATEAQPVDQ